MKKIAFSGSRKHEVSSAVLRRMARALAGGNHYEVIVGCCKTGIDKCVREAFGISLNDGRCFRADWEKQGNAAGPIRNGKMIDVADRLGALPDHHDLYHKKGGTWDTIQRAFTKGIPVLVIPVGNEADQ